MEKLYHGSCHCGAVKIRARIDLSKGTGRCNCSFCRKNRYWGVSIKPEDFTLVAGENDLSDYLFNTRSIHHLFCKHCGGHTFLRGNIPDIGGEFCGIYIACMDDVDEQELAASPIYYADGLHNNWQHSPEETRHL